jgi:hypothetical protein
MSLPSIKLVAAEMGVDLNKSTTPEQQEEILVGAMKRDLRPALDFLHRKAHEAEKNGGSADWQEDPKSEIGKQLTRIHAGTVLRHLVSKHFCHGRELTFFNCCSGTVGTAPNEQMLRQIQCQAGPIAYSDC